MSATLAAAGIVSALAGLCFLLVARRVGSRGATGDRLLARRAHMAWWGGLGAYLVLQGALTLAASADLVTTGTYLASRVAAIPLLCFATWGITFYLVYLYTGEAKLALPLAGLYAVVALLFFYATFSIPQTLVVERWIITLDDSSPVYRIVYALVGLPPILASVAYLRLLGRTPEAEQRYRIRLIAGSILLYVASGLAARLSAASDAIVFVTLVLLGLAAAGASLAAYYPPAFVRRRFAQEGGG